MDKDSIYNQLLVLRCRQGTDGAWEELVSRWERPLLYYIRRMVEDEQEAWQILQETWLHVVKGIPTLKYPEFLPKWLYSICRKMIMTYYRKHHRDMQYLQDTLNNGEVKDVEPGTHFENAEAVHWGLMQLSPAFREVLTLFFLQDLSLDEIAEVLKIPAGTVKSRLYYARRQLYKILEVDHEQ